MTYFLAQSATPSPATAAQPGGQPVQPTDLKLLDWNGWGFEVRIGLVWFLVAVIVVIAVWWLLPWIRRKWLKGYRTSAVKLTFKGVEWEVCPDVETRRIAHQAWVEIKSRKVGLPFEEGLDVIAEVYDSWYQLFGVLRDLAKSVPANRLQDCEETRKVVALLDESSKRRAQTSLDHVASEVSSLVSSGTWPGRDQEYVATGNSGAVSTNTR